jgi:hypothetical protein
MDNAVALVQAYLRLNGYFTVCEFPIIETSRNGYRTVTDLDVLGFRFPRADRLLGQSGRAAGEHTSGVDPALGCDPEKPDMLIGEVKEGRPRLNDALRNAKVLETVLVRFGCCPPHHVTPVVRDLLRRGSAETACGHTVRLVVFANGADRTNGAETVVSLQHVLQFLNEYIEQHWDALRHAQIKDPAFAFMMLAQKAAHASEVSHASGRSGP